MKFLIIILFLLMSFSQMAQAYVFNMPNNTTFKNDTCTLTLGKKVITRDHMGSIVFQKATLTIYTKEGKIVTHPFTSIDSEYNKNAVSEFGAFKHDDGRLVIQGEKLNSLSIAIQEVMKSTNGTQNTVVDCGVLIQEVDKV